MNEPTGPAVRHPFQDPDLPVARRVDDLVSRMTLEEKSGSCFQTMTPYGDITAPSKAFGLPSLTSMVRSRHMTHFNLLGAAATAREMAQWHNEAQELALSTRLGIPLTLSTDPRHGFTDNPGAAMMAGPFSRWPESLGLAAVGDRELVREFADVARQEYLAVGLRVALHPQIDLTTEPRWSRCHGTFGEDAELAGHLVSAYIEGFRGGALGSGSVATMVKHFPGGGPQKDGEDPHFAHGREQVYPGGFFDYHLEPFKVAIAAGATQMMPYYGMPVGTEHEEVGFGFSSGILDDLLRGELAFDGIVCTDWGLLTDATVMGQPMPARAWGVEHLSRPERMLRAVQAGVDQFGGEVCSEVLVELVATGQVTEARLDLSVARLLKEKFLLGLFDRPFVDPEQAQTVVGSSRFRDQGLAAQRAAVTVLTDDPPGGSAAEPVLPLRADLRVYVEGLDPQALDGRARVVGDVGSADVAILRLQAPFERRGGGFEAYFHSGSLEFDAETLDHVAEVCRAVPTVVDVYLDRPAVLTPLTTAAALVVTFGTSDAALVDVLFGGASPRGRLPFDLPRSMAAVEASRTDVPFDTEDPLFRFGHGLDVRARAVPAG